MFNVESVCFKAKYVGYDNLSKYGRSLMYVCGVPENHHKLVINKEYVVIRKTTCEGFWVTYELDGVNGSFSDFCFE